MNPNAIYDKTEKIYKMNYATGEYYEPDVICYATSKNGIIWEKYKNNPILIPNNIKHYQIHLRSEAMMFIKFQLITI